MTQTERGRGEDVIRPIIFVSVMYIRLSDLRKTKNKDGALEKNVGHQFEFPRQDTCII